MSNGPSQASEAVSELVETLGPRVFKMGMKFCGERGAAEDLVQETFLQAYRKWDQFEGRSDPASWLYMIAARGCQRMRRRRSGEPARLDSLDELLPSGQSAVAEIPSPGPDPFEDEVRREAAEIVDAALARLPENVRLPLVLKEVGDLSLAEIADALGMKEATVKTRVHRGRLALRAELVKELDTARPVHADHSRQICLDLLHAKMEAMDRGVEFPIPPENLCDRCRSFIGSLDLARDACRWIDDGELSPDLRQRIEGLLAAETGAR